MIEESSAIPTLEGRNEIYAEVVQRVYEQAPMVMLFDVIETAGHAENNVQGVYLEPAGVNWPAKYAWIQQEGEMRYALTPSP